ncbi:unnamed protein product [Clavelina lepadiformis]|uniref:Centrosomal protein of 162 kDa n=1 Tax=Clavelina lepadiformis TaxID=159417 RepID=A0ABP0FW43_CLALP
MAEENNNIVEDGLKTTGGKDGKMTPGGLLANVSLLTTGGSSLQQQLTQNDTLRFAGETLHQTKGKKAKNQVDTSTPARPFGTNNVMYGFDLSPVHSHELPSSARDQDTVEKSPEPAKDVLQPSIQDKLEDEFFADSKTKAAPNFIQASLVSSSHQSRLSTRTDKSLNDDTETMMSQVYSQSSKPKRTGHSPRQAKKNTSISVHGSRSTLGLSPRKSSKTYAHIHSSGYGAMTPVKLSNKKSESRKKMTGLSPKKKAKPKKTATPPTSFVSAKHEQFYSVQETPVLPEKPGWGQQPMNTYKIDSGESKSIFKGTSADLTIDDSHDVHLALLEKQLQDRRALEEKYNTLEKECSQLKVNNAEVNQENFLLSAKLNKLLGVTESSEVPIKDSLNDKNKDPSDSEVQQLKTEILEQERLLKGYQQENEKLYGEVAKLKASTRENESAMFDENLRLKNKVAALREDLMAKDAIIKDKNRLLGDKTNLKPRVFNEALQTNKDSSERVSVEKWKEASKQLAEMRDKISWYEKNQAILEERCEGLTHSGTEMANLREKVKLLEKQLNEKATSFKKQSEQTGDLRRQVKELENITMKSQTFDHVKSILHGNDEVILLEKRCRHLEDQLKEQEDKSAKSMQSLHQLYKKMSADYESRVNNLSKQLEVIKLNSRKAPHKQPARSPDETLLREIDKLKVQAEGLRQENQKLKDEVQSLFQDLLHERRLHKVKSPGKKKGKLEGIPYNPGYFSEHIEAKAKPTVEDDVKTKEIERLQKSMNAVKSELFKEISHWKKLYEETKSSNDALKQRQDVEIESLKSSHEKSVAILKNDLSTLSSKVTVTESKLYQCQSELSSSKACENALQIQIKSLLDELQATRRGSPSVVVRHVEALQAQVRMLDFRQKSREDRLNKVVSAGADEYLKAEINSLHGVISEKNLLLSKFRYELDTILQVLETLQRDKST